MMRSLLTCAIAMLLGATALSAQSPIEPLGADKPEMIASFTAETPIYNQSTEGRAYWVVVAWRTGANDVEYTIDVSTVERSGQPSIFAAYTTEEIFDHIGIATIQAGLDSAYSSCTSSSQTTGITLARCATQTSTGYTADGSALVRREYSYTCASIAQTGVDGGGSCGSGSEPTSGGGSLQ